VVGQCDKHQRGAFVALHNYSTPMPSQWGPWESWYQLFRKPYWKRVWIIQELILAKKVFWWYGTLRGDAAEFWRIGRGDGNVNIIRDTAGWRLLALRNCWWSPEVDRETRADTFSLQRLSATFATSKSTDPRNYMYAFLGIAYETVSSNAARYLRPDYTRLAVQVLIDVLQSHYVDHDEPIESEVYTGGASSWLPYSTQVTKTQDFVAHLQAKLGVSQAELTRHVALCAPRFHQHIPATSYEELREREQALLEQQRIAENSASYQRRLRCMRLLGRRGG
jgi:hypothetical protein